MSLDQQWEHLRKSADRHRAEIKASRYSVKNFRMQAQLGQSELMIDLHDRLKKLEDLKCGRCGGSGYDPENTINDPVTFIPEPEACEDCRGTGKKSNAG